MRASPRTVTWSRLFAGAAPTQPLLLVKIRKPACKLVREMPRGDEEQERITELRALCEQAQKLQEAAAELCAKLTQQIETSQAKHQSLPDTGTFKHRRPKTSRRTK
jgi:hypothetical protein